MQTKLLTLPWVSASLVTTATDQNGVVPMRDCPCKGTLSPVLSGSKSHTFVSDRNVGAHMVTIALTGDLMLGRLVDEWVIRDDSVPTTAIWGDVLPDLLEADVRIGNLECVISEGGSPWRPDSKAFHFRAAPRAIEFLRAANMSCVTLANNHVLDYGAEALRECLTHLDLAAIAHTGAGHDLRQAMEPALLSRSGLSIAVIGVTDNEPEWEAGETASGVNFVSYRTRGLIEPYRSRLIRTLHKARERAQFVIVGAHVGPNWGAPSPSMQALAHDLIDLGADLYWGHSNHTPQGIELYRGKAILYSAGDFIDDYAVEPSQRNDLSFLFLVEIDAAKVSRIRLIPVSIEHCTVRKARPSEEAWLWWSMTSKCRLFETHVSFSGGEGRVEIA